MRKIVRVLALLAAVLFLPRAWAEDGTTKPLAIFVGTSSIAKWETLADDFPDMRVMNFGVEGSPQMPKGQMLSSVAKLIDDDVVGRHPDIVVLYAGENDLAVGTPPKKVHDDLKAITAKLEVDLPNVRIVYVSLKPSPERMGIVDQIIAVDRWLQEDSWSDPHLRFADVFSWMLEKGDVRCDLFTSDLLHMNASGYEIWAHVINEAMK